MDNLVHIIDYVTLVFIGMAGSVFRYLNVSKSEDLTLRDVMIQMAIGGLMAIFADLFTDYLRVTGPLKPLLIGLAAMSSKEILAIVPTLLKTLINTKK